MERLDITYSNSTEDEGEYFTKHVAIDLTKTPDMDYVLLQIQHVLVAAGYDFTGLQLAVIESER